MCTYWEGADFKGKLEKAKKNNRSSLKVLHSTGSQSYVDIQQTLRDELGREPIMDEFRDRAHVGSTVTEAVSSIRDRFKGLRAQRLEELQADTPDPEATQTQLSRDEEIRL